MFKNYTYWIRHTRSSILWYCSSRKAGCRASLRSNRDKPTLVMSSSLEHNHDPPRYHQTKEGMWVKVKI
ncbi:hypothetical protein JYU34_004344 [Plutella xylostella]|uniref:FLYWCH-type domain-containing protein n=1 Tax=Plutella xylostella TaxID=51655 RepID=A0ABQ7QXR2_PLUXY|nr:hypothetical protein JYU34_004344 [Plutella xylostella]